jgi:AcrR family transcriptional regulator
MTKDAETQPRRRDAAASKERLLAAAAAEFVAHGIAGARVDRIAAAAGANKRLIYDYFGDKDALFDAVLDRFTERAVGAVPMDASDLPAYAGHLFDYHCDNPDLLRLVTWARLEGRTTPSAQEQRRASYQRRAAAIQAAQHTGAVTTILTGSQLLDIIESLAVGWTAAARGVLATPRQLKAERAAQRTSITEAVRRIVDPELSRRRASGKTTRRG